MNNNQDRVSEFLGRLSESATLAMSRKSRELQEKGVDVVNLSLGEPDFETPDFIKAAAKEGIDQNFTHYMPVPGYLDFRKSICAKFERDNKLNFTPDQIVVSTGAKQTIVNIVLATVSEGDEVLLPAPYWVSYIEMVKMAGAKPVVIETQIENDYKITADELAAAITPQTKLMIFSSPCNPSGSVYSEAELNALADVLEKHSKITIVSDEIYEHINYRSQHFSIGRIDKLADRVATVNGVSKAFAMTGWRIGYMGAPLWLAQACTKLQGQFTSGASGISQRAAKAAVEANPSVTNDMKAEFLKRRGFMQEALGAIPGFEVNEPEGAFYMFPKVSAYFGKSYNGTAINNSDDLAEYILAEGHVATVSGAAFGSPECLRISYAAAPKDLAKATERIAEALSKLN